MCGWYQYLAADVGPIADDDDDNNVLHLPLAKQTNKQTNEHPVALIEAG